MLTKHIRKQQRGSLYIAVVWTAILAFLMYIAAQIFQNGLGEASSGRGFGLKGRISTLLRDMEAQGGPAKWILLAVCAAVGIYVVTRIVQALRNMAKKRTQLGSSLCRQAEPGEDFEELCRKVDLDMERGYQEFAGIVFVSSSWIMEDEIMRISRLKSVCDRIDSDEKALILEDVDGNCMTLSFLMRDWGRELLEYLKKHTAIADTDAGEAQGKAQSGRMFSWHVQKSGQQIEQLRASAAQGDARAQTEYAKCLLFGKGQITVDETEAFAWLKKAADQSDEIAKMYLGHCLLYGLGTEKDEAEGYRMLNAALDYNYPEDSSSQPLAQYSAFENEDLVQMFQDLGDAFENGLGVERNDSVAAYYFNMMADWGHPEGAERMRSYKKGVLGWKRV